ncbi:MAG: S16 family serine protease [Desulfurococcaceae archaeon]
MSERMLVKERSLGVFLLICLLASAIFAGSLNGFLNYKEVRTTDVYAPAVSSGGQGVLSKITLAVAYPGEGRVFFSALPYTEVETQGAARIAAYIASLVAGVDFFSYDYYVLVESKVPLIGGPSAGALMTIGLASLLLNTELYGNVTITGMINPDGTIGPVGGLKEKLEAVASSGFKIFLIPRGQRIYTYPVYTERRIGRVVIREVTYRSIDLVEYGKSLGVKVVEVGDIAEALYYFTGYKLGISNPTALISDLTEHIILNKLRHYFEEVSNEIKYYTARATRIAQSVGAYYNRQYYISVLGRINQTLDHYISLFNDYPYYASYKLLDTLELAARVYYSLVDSTTALSEARHVISLVTEGVQADSCTLDNSIAQGLVTMAWLYYTYAENSTTRDYQVVYLSKSVRLSAEAKLYSNLSRDSPIILELVCDTSVYTKVYAHVRAVYTYISKLIEDVGAGTDHLSEVGPYMNALDIAYIQNDSSVYGLAMHALAYSTLALHSALGSGSYVDYNRLFSIYGEPKSISSYFLLRAAAEARNYEDTRTGLMLLQLYVFSSQVTVVTYGLLQQRAVNQNEPSPDRNLTNHTSVVSGEVESEARTSTEAGAKEHLDVVKVGLIIALAGLIIALAKLLRKLELWKGG